MDACIYINGEVMICSPPVCASPRMLVPGYLKSFPRSYLFFCLPWNYQDLKVTTTIQKSNTSTCFIRSRICISELCYYGQYNFCYVHLPANSYISICGVNDSSKLTAALNSNCKNNVKLEANNILFMFLNCFSVVGTISINKVYHANISFLYNA